VKIFNKYAAKIAALAGIEKKLQPIPFGIRGQISAWTWGIDIRKISSGLGHSTVQVTEKHYGKSVSEKILDEIKAKITKVQSP
jgi:hypothetical protein|tara:strand:- start:171 stop:419 length:249 start_codon:yes stop_codon:yes gene_type:complete